MVKKHDVGKYELEAVDTVISIALSDYRKLIEDRLELKRLLANRKQLEVPARSTIARNPEVGLFLLGKLGLEPMSEILRKCRREFGSGRTPSKSAAYRFWKSLRNGREGN